jgi:hypothetical protein
VCWPSHHWSAGTIAFTWAMWSPQPAQVVLPQTVQVTGRHILGPPWLVMTEYTQGGYTGTDQDPGRLNARIG